jgi:hypothetical protein
MMKCSPQAIYHEMDALAAELANAGQQDLADVILHRVHKVAWTSRSELLTELRTVLTDALKQPTTVAALKQKLADSLAAVDKEINAASVPFKPARLDE